MATGERIILYWPRGPRFWRPRVKYAEGHLLEGRRHGKWVFWYKGGGKQLEGQYLKGKKTGTWVKWDEKGKRISEGGFLYDKMHGTWTDWHGNGQKALQSSWVMGKKDSEWAYWAPDGSLEKREHYDHRRERDMGYSIHTDLEEKEIIRKVQMKTVHKDWERLVGKSIASLVKPWQVACWLLLFIPLFALVRAGTPWRSAAFAAILAFLVTGLLTWSCDRKKRGAAGD